MSKLIALSLVVVAGVVAYALGRATLARLVAGGVEREKARRAEADSRAAKRQAEIMMERRSVENVSQDLDHGRF
ncbi:hypothetical protein IYX23_13470 [Methylocystis sp. L43]|jgi:hypothetical protein|uniref:hypothetical protein n=1 Tax=unclassified Methylocystis TaxID=2625913 RepID=UPI0018C2DD66|nr:MULTISPECIES: hypothetical protein [unclassified Methylocystis]MBG0798678.1 hypothetical protein [Methylocystis sp. L43]MBG0806993.1 hypothetical protein [Methylocystis sp. H15]